MNVKSVVCALVVLYVGPGVALGSDTNALSQLKAVEKSSKDAAKDAKAGKLESAKEKAARGFDTPAVSTTTVTAPPVSKRDQVQEICRRANEEQRKIDKEKAKKYKLDDPSKAPPKP